MCFSALLSAVGFTGALPLRFVALADALCLRLCVRLPWMVGGVLLRGGESNAGVCTSSFSSWRFEGPGTGAGSALGERIVWLSQCWLSKRVLAA